MMGCTTSKVCRGRPQKVHQHCRVSHSRAGLGARFRAAGLEPVTSLACRGETKVVRMHFGAGLLQGACACARSSHASTFRSRRGL